jgi:hypothetical protein
LSSLFSAIAISPEGDQILSGDWDKRVLLWDTVSACDAYLVAEGLNLYGANCRFRRSERKVGGVAIKQAIVGNATKRDELFIARPSWFCR